MFILASGLISNPLPGDTGSSNPSERLAIIRGKIADAERDVRNIEAALTQAILNPGIPVDSDGNPGNGIQPLFDTDDANILRQKLYQARAHEGELRTAETFWNQIVEGNKGAENETKDLFKKAG